MAAILALVAVGVLFATYGTALPPSPFSTLEPNRPTQADSNGEHTAFIDTESSRALILDANGQLTGMVLSTMLDSPFDAMTDVSLDGDTVYLSGVQFAPDSDDIERERVAKYDTQGNFLGVVYEHEGLGGSRPMLKALCSAPGGFVVAREVLSVDDANSSPIDSFYTDKRNEVLFEIIDGSGQVTKTTLEAKDGDIYDAAFSAESNLYGAVLSIRGVLEDTYRTYGPDLLKGHVFTAIAIDDNATLYACDDIEGGLFAIDPVSQELRMIVDGNGWNDVHENSGVLSLGDSEGNVVKTCDITGAEIATIREAGLSPGLFARVLIVWASALYLIALVAFLAIRKLYR